MRAAAIMLAGALVFAQARVIEGTRANAQETQTVPNPVVPSAPQTTQTTPAQQPAQQPAAPVVRRAAKPAATSIEPVAGPLTGHGAAGAPPEVRTPSGGVETIHVQTRLVNVALNVVDEHGAPVGGFERQDFQIFEDGKPQTIAIFDREATSPLSIVLAIDSSETVLTSERLERDAAKHFVRAILRPQDEIDLMDFSDTVREIVPFTNQARRVDDGLGEVQRGQETSLYNAVFLASQRLDTTSQAAGRRRVLVVISDGGDSVRGESYGQAVEQAQRAGVMIFSIIIVPIAADAGRNTGGEHTLIQMSEDTGGKYYYVEDPSDLEPAFQHVSDDLRTQYLLAYYAPESSESAFRRIKVKLTDPALDAKYSLRYRTGYFADGH